MRARPILLAASLLALACLPACFLFRGGKETNILLVVVESLRYDAISRASGSARTPNMQALVSEGVAFRSCFSHTPLSQPSLASLLSSRLPHEHGLMTGGDTLEEGVALLPEWLEKRGFQTFAAFGLASSLPAKAGHGLDRGFEKRVAFPHELASSDEVLDSFESFLTSASPDKPWFGMLQLSETRQPFDSCEEEHVEAQLVRDGEEPESLAIADNCWWERTAQLAPGRTRFTVHSETPMRVLRFGARAGKRALNVVFERGALDVAGKDFVISVENPDGDPLECALDGWFHDAPPLAECRKRYRREIEAVDEALGRLFEDLRARGVYDNTLIVLTSDHGIALGEHAQIGRGNALFDEFLHVPLVVKPVKDDERLEALLRSQTDIVRHVDVVPTMLELAKVRPMPGSGGGSLLEHRARELIAETHTGEPAGSSFAIRDERFKLVLGAAENRYAMYDLRSDTLEQENVFPLQGQNKPEWQRRLGALVGGVHAPAKRPADARLQVLGY